jgi:hypothetical protein
MSRAVIQTPIDLGQLALAAEHLDNALHNFTPSINDQMRAIAKQAYADTLKRVGKLHIVVKQDGAEVFVNGRSVGQSPLESNVYVDGGECTIEARNGNKSDKQSLVVDIGKETTVTLAPRAAQNSSDHVSSPAASSASMATPSQPVESASHIEHRSYVPIFVGGALFAIGVGTAIGFKLDQSSTDDKADKLRNSVGTNGCGVGSLHPNECSAIADAANTRDRDSKFQVIGLGLAGTALVATSVYWFWPRSSTDFKAGSITIGIHASVAPGSGFAHMSGSF